MKKRLKFILKYMRPYTMQFIMVFVIILITTIIVAFYPYLFGRLVDTLFYDRDVSSFIRILIIYFIVYSVNQMLHYCLDMTMAKLRINYSFDIKKSVFSKVISYKSEELTDLQTGNIIHHINSDSEEVLNFIYGDIFYGISAFLDFIISFVMITIISPYLSIILLFLVFFMLVITNIFERRLKPLYEKMKNLADANQSWLFEILHSMREVKLLNAGKYCLNKYVKGETTLIKTSEDVVKKELLSERINGVIELASTLTIYVLVAIFIAANLLTLGGLVACIDYFNRMIITLNRLYIRRFTISNRIISINRVMETLDNQSELELQKIKSYVINNGEILFRDVEFYYKQSQPILKHFDFHICAGETVALVGKSGVGKSTVAELLCGLYDIIQGEIILDGRNLNEIPLSDLRRQIGLVQQTVTLFENTIRYNLIFSNEKITDEQIWQALREVELYDVIKKLSNGLDTIITPSEINLSGGQKQRLAVARAYLKRPKILILDEATSALDENIEAEVMRMCERKFSNCTVLIIAHRLSTIIRCDKVAFLSDGRIVSYDKHEVLLEKNERYQELFHEQDHHYLGEGD